MIAFDDAATGTQSLRTVLTAGLAALGWSADGAGPSVRALLGQRARFHFASLSLPLKLFSRGEEIHSQESTEKATDDDHPTPQ